jgi:hypothetical protein
MLFLVLEMKVKASCRIHFRSFRDFRASVSFPCMNCDELLSWGIGPGRGQVACTCSRSSRWRFRRDSRGTDGRLRRSCSTFDLGCSHLNVLEDLRYEMARIHTRHVAVTTAGVAGLSTLASAESTTTTTVAALVSTESAATTVSTSLWAVTRDVTDL